MRASWAKEKFPRVGIAVATTVIRDWPPSIRVAAVLASAAIVCGLLFWAQVVLVPLALAALLTFLLTPVVDRLERWGLGRIPSVILIVILLALILGGVGWVLANQMSSLAADFRQQDYKDNITEKYLDLRAMFRGGAIEKVQRTLEEVQEKVEEEEKEELAGTTQPQVADPQEGKDEPVAVRLAPDEYLLPDTSGWAPVFQVLGTAGLVIVLVLFMLIYREDVLSRLVSLAGPNSLAVTTRALDEASRRISRYLLMQFIINASYGMAVSLGLFFIGVPYAALWGLAGFVFRYIPYIGPWIAALLPITISLVHFPGWTPVLLVVGLFVALELFVNNVMEPYLYGHSVGLSSVAVIVAAVFWTWLWGPVGLVLATPLTVCLVVLGEHIPGLAIFDRLLSDRPAMKPHLWLYQRLLAGDEEDAEDIVEDYVEENSPEMACDELLLPTLLVARRERASQRIAEDDEQQILSILGEIIEGLPHWSAQDAADEAEEGTSGEPPRKVTAVGFTMHEADVLVFRLLERLVDPRKCELEILSPDMLIAERIATLEEKQPALVCLSSLPPSGLRQARAVCKSISSRYPDLKILVGRWSNRGISAKTQQIFRASCAEATVATLSQMRDTMLPIAQFHSTARAADEQSLAKESA